MDPHQLVEQVNEIEGLDALVSVVDQRRPDVLRSGRVRDLLAGETIGHALHPMLTDVPLGTWTSATMLDVLGRGRWIGASATLTGIGLVTSLPTVASGLVEWGGTPEEQRRVTAVHAAFNGVATGCYLVSFVAKLAGRQRLGTRSALLGALASGAGGYLGGHLSLGRGVGVGDRSGPATSSREPATGTAAGTPSGTLPD